MCMLSNYSAHLACEWVYASCQVKHLTDGKCQKLSTSWRTVGHPF